MGSSQRHERLQKSLGEGRGQAHFPSQDLPLIAKAMKGVRMLTGLPERRRKVEWQGSKLVEAGHSGQLRRGGAMVGALTWRG